MVTAKAKSDLTWRVQAMMVEIVEARNRSVASETDPTEVHDAISICSEAEVIDISSDDDEDDVIAISAFAHTGRSAPGAPD